MACSRSPCIDAAASVPLRGGVGMSLFAEGRYGEDDKVSAWGGLRFYFGEPGKPLIRRHREDDPPIFLVEDFIAVGPDQGSTTARLAASMKAKSNLAVTSTGLLTTGAGLGLKHPQSFGTN